MYETTRTPVFSRYELLDELGSGGMGTVFKARQKFVGRLVAFKVLPPGLREDDETLKRFEREAEALGRLKHPHVVTVFDAGVEGGFPYLAMEFVEGKDLRKTLKERKRLTVDEVTRLGIEVAEALDHMDERGLVHRDLKPSNIIIDEDGRAVLTDFGIAFAATMPRITQGAMGTPEFMSPEQADGKPLDIRTDLFSLGVVMYECLVGELPFRREGEGLTSLTKMLHQIINEPPPSVTAKRAEVPQELSEIVSKLMQKDPALRYQKASELATALRKEPQKQPSGGYSLLESYTFPASVIFQQVSAESPAKEEPIASSPAKKPEPKPLVGPASTKNATSSDASRSVKEEKVVPVLPKPRELDIQEAPQVKVEKKPEVKKKTRRQLRKEAREAAKRGERPKAKTAFKLWLIAGFLLFIYDIFDGGVPSFADGAIIFNFLALTPAITGALVTLLSGTTQNSSVWRGIFLGTMLGIVLSGVLSTAIMRLIESFGWESYILPADDLTAALIAGSIIASAFSSAITGLCLGIKFWFASRKAARNEKANSEAS